MNHTSLSNLWPNCELSVARLAGGTAGFQPKVSAALEIPLRLFYSDIVIWHGRVAVLDSPH
jgi:hypothetical protein